MHRRVNCRRFRRRAAARFRGPCVASAALLVLACGTGAGDDRDDPAGDGDGVGVAAYCAEFARAYASGSASRVAGLPVSVRREPAALGWLSNVFQPAGSRFVSGYRCRFATVSPDGSPRTISVGLYLAETRAFAEHTRWEALGIVPIRLVRDEAAGVAGHGVFKYLRRE